MEEDDPFDYALAVELGTTHRAIQELPHDEYIGWRAYMTWRTVQREHAADVAAMRAARRTR